MKHFAPSFKSGIGFRFGQRKGAMVLDVITALVLLSFVVHPVIVEQYDEDGELVSTLDWTMPMDKVLDYLDNCEALVDRAWVGMDTYFGYTGPKMSTLAMPLMKETVQSGLSLMTAGVISRDGVIATDVDTVVDNYEESTYSQSLIFYQTALAGMETTP